MRVYVIQCRLGVIVSDEDRAALAVGLVVVHGTAHDMVDHHSQSHIGVSDLHRRGRAGEVLCLRGSRVIVWLVNIQELRQRAFGYHPIKVAAEFLRATLIRNVEVISREL